MITLMLHQCKYMTVLLLLCAGFRQERRVRDEDDERQHEDHNDPDPCEL